MENVSKIGELLAQSNSIINGLNLYKNKYSKGENQCDKSGLGFNLDDRFKACKGLTIYVSSWKGYYGSSSCSMFIDLDEKIFNKHLLKVLDKNFNEIMTEVAASIKSEAVVLKDAAKSELTTQLEKLNALSD